MRLCVCPLSLYFAHREEDKADNSVGSDVTGVKDYSVASSSASADVVRDGVLQYIVTDSLT